MTLIYSKNHQRFQFFACITFIFVCISSMGCVNSLKNTIPAQCLPPEYLDPSRDELVPIDFTILGQKPPTAYVIGPQDVLGIHIQGILGHGQEIQPETHYPSKFGDSATGNFTSPAVGSPVTVMADGTISLPQVPAIVVSGLTLPEATQKIRDIYIREQLIQPGRDVIQVSVIKARSVQVLVLREDSIMNWPIFKQNNSTLAVKRGSGRAVDLPNYQNDVLHALTETGGLPGSDACDEVWVLHGASKDHWEVVASSLITENSLPPSPSAIATGYDSGESENSSESNPPDSLRRIPSSLRSRVTKIPLKIMNGESIVVRPEEVILGEGDVVFIPARDREHFFVGGVLSGQQVYLPRDYELDVIGAIAMAGGQPAGPPMISMFSGQSPGSILPPTRVFILRKVAGGEQVTIHVDLKKALRNRRERIPIRPGDVILLQYTPLEIVGNYLINAINFNAGVSRGYFTNVP